MTTLRMAWRNIWRQPRRTLMTAAAVALGLAGMIVWLGLIEGMNDHLLKAATEGWVGDGQIHAEGFRESQDLETLIEDNALLSRLQASEHVAAAAPRLFADALVAIGDRSSGVRAVGTDLAAEAVASSGWVLAPGNKRWALGGRGSAPRPSHASPSGASAAARAPCEASSGPSGQSQQSHLAACIHASMQMHTYLHTAGVLAGQRIQIIV